ncbi:uncharacterized protein SCHCODRAFT_02686764 [Schizophyllum commune H4-8]|uniref:uncharacterized protein n=1 Tax=Schizophyllum commune (strain H4-8 / FGSC 9210) TaxID=578458 RepID=UPI00215F5861|nr:uncharacterized protein SCHCODRAFT_02686764 [Schizophyllum commune H4-8]KAI5895365.1 hypothetical protein SCHCODRAFT_02686764 [Schizophyllum commune H4-8]
MTNIDSFPIPSSSSIISFEVGDLLDSWNPPVLAESLSIDTLSTSSSAISIPSLPLGCMITRPAIVDLKGGLQSRFAKVTVPTVPRMRAMLKDEPCVDRWLDNLRYSSIPGHSPWGETEDAAAPSWLPEGSSYTPEAFRQALSSARSSPAYQTIFRKARSSAPGDGSSSPTSPTPISPTLLRRMSYHPSSFRDALVFEREISLKSEAGVKRWSMQVPASTMKPELVDIVVELQKLNSFFNDGLTDLNQGVSALDQHKQRVTTPALTVSDSHETIPLPLERVKENTTTLIANRRGKKAPPALNLKRQTPEDTYPGIPTAFLGTPSAYHPELDPRPKREGPAMNINDMISSLRSQCAAISRSPTSEVASSPLESVSEEPEESKVARNHDNAQDYMSAKDQQALAFSVAVPQLSDDESLMRRTLPLDLVDIQETLSDVGSDHLTESFSDFLREFESEALQPPSMPGTPMMPPSLPLPSLPPLTLPAVPTRALPDPPAGSLEELPTVDHRNSLDDMDWSPPTPPQPCRSPSPSLSPRQGGLRGILKGGKNVRFASLPTNRRETSPGAIEAYAAGRTGDGDGEDVGDWGGEGQWALDEQEDVMEDYFSRERKGSILKSPTEASSSSRSSTESMRSPTEAMRSPTESTGQGYPTSARGSTLHWVRIGEAARGTSEAATGTSEAAVTGPKTPFAAALDVYSVGGGGSSGAGASSGCEGVDGLAGQGYYARCRQTHHCFLREVDYARDCAVNYASDDEVHPSLSCKAHELAGQDCGHFTREVEDVVRASEGDARCFEDRDAIGEDDAGGIRENNALYGKQDPRFFWQGYANAGEGHTDSGEGHADEQDPSRDDSDGREAYPICDESRSCQVARDLDDASTQDRCVDQTDKHPR